MNDVETDQRLTADDGTVLRRRRWVPAGRPRAVVAIAHGYGEYGGRYAELASRLIEAGYAVETIDARGHGDSEGTRVKIDSLDTLADDFGRLCETLSTGSPRPLFVLGHSLGSLVAIKYVLPRQDRVAGLILSGNALAGEGGMPAAALPLLHVLGRWLPDLRVIPALRPEELSTDPDVVARYRNDPLVDRGRWRLGTASSAMRAIRECRASVAELTLPLLVIHGGRDRMLSADGARFAVEQAGSADKTLRIYADEFHEPLSGFGKAEVIRALIEWLDARTPWNAG